MAGRQVRNWAAIQIYTQFLEQYRQIHGRFPASIADAVPPDAANRDVWLGAHDCHGHPLHYASDGTRFLLASFGRDGVRDGREYARLRPGERHNDSPCYDADADTVFSSDGVFQA